MDKGVVGLRNRGNTCYLNTSIQCLSNIPDLTDYILNNEYVDDLNNRFQELRGGKMNEILLSKEYTKLIKAMWNSNSAIEPRTFHELIQRLDSRFKGFEQQDSQESLAFILDHLHEGLKYDADISFNGNIENDVDEIMVESIKKWKLELKDQYSIIVELFFGQFINKIVSMEENHTKDKIISKTFEVFNMLNISIHGSTLYDSLSMYFGKEILETKYFNEKTNEHISAYRQIKLMKIPKFLILVLKRYNNTTGNLKKSNNIITFPLEDLDLSTYAEGYDRFDCKLDLVCVGCHKGILNGGHYFSICKHRNENWYKYDDESITKFDIKNDIVNLFRDGYILIYKKKDD